jgi:polyisoprenoid-binding protein YceI
MTDPAPRRRLSRGAIIAVSVVGAVVVLGAAAFAFGPAFYRDVIAGDAPAAPTVDPAPTATTPGPSGDAVTDFDGEWTAADGSYAGYRVDEVLRGEDVTVVGRTEEVTAEVRVQDLAVTDAVITVDVASIATDQPARDAYFRDTALQVSEHPTATFELTEPIPADAPPAAGDTTRVEVTGDLTLHGVTRQVTAEVEAAFDGSAVQVAGSIPVTFADFGVEAPDLGFVSVEPEGSVEFLLVLDQAA